MPWNTTGGQSGLQLMLTTPDPLFDRRMRAWIDLALMFLTFTLTIVWSVEVGVAVSIVISLLLVIHRSSKARLMILVSHRLCSPRLVSGLD